MYKQKSYSVGVSGGGAGKYNKGWPQCASKSQFQFRFESATQPTRDWVTWPLLIPTSFIALPHPTCQLHASHSGFSAIQWTDQLFLRLRTRLCPEPCPSFYLDLTVLLQGVHPIPQPADSQSHWSLYPPHQHCTWCMWYQNHRFFSFSLFGWIMNKVPLTPSFLLPHISRR